MEIKGTYRCDTTHHPNALNSWDIRSVSVDLPEEEDKPYWIRAGAMVIGFILVMLGWYLVFGY
ncbi:transmembrane domain containing protein [Ruminococcus phage phiRM10]|uniref:Transmembrane domain containing protein n=1 Tax=Ruminococcus phage phiRM10 TaxID=2772516 RepID=A0AAE7T1Z2_9CAUD|nr:transmembrane domain containing protein [Ruminococcus phage phiRM10]